MKDPSPLFRTKLDLSIARDPTEGKMTRWKPIGEAGSWNLDLSPGGMIVVSAGPQDGEHRGALTEEEAQQLLKMDRFALRWHLRGYTELANELELPNDQVVFGFYPPEYVEKYNKPLHTIYFLYGRVKP